MLRSKQIRKLAPSRERGMSMPELAVGGLVLCIGVFGIIEIGRAMAAYNALADAVRAGARYACMNTAGSTTQVQNMVVFGTPTVGTRPIAPGLTTAKVFVTYSTNPVFGMNSGWVKVEVRNYSFAFNVPLFGASYTMRTFTASANAESAGVIPGTLP